MSDTKIDVDSEVDALFMLPLKDFTAARNALATRLKKAPGVDDVAGVKALAKPPISAWAVNQLYWKHRNEFDRLVAAGERLAHAHAAQLAGKAADLREPLASRRGAISVLLLLAAALLRDAGHNSTPDSMRRIETTLEALSTSATPFRGRLTDDVGPLGFDSLAALVSGGRPAGSAETSQPPAGGSMPASRIGNHSTDKQAESRQATLVSARAALESAKQALRESRNAANRVAADLKKASDVAAQAEESRRRAEELLKKASDTAEVARRSVRDLDTEMAKADRVLQNAESAVEEARKELERSKEPTST